MTGVLGDFEEIYGSPDEDNEHIGQWDAIMTCFFIDTVGPSSLIHRSSVFTRDRPG